MKLANYNDVMQQALQGNSDTLMQSFTPVSRMDTYQQSIKQRFLEALDACYPCCRRLVGDECWYGLLNHYLLDRQVTTVDVSTIGQQLSEFIQTTALHQQLAYFSDMAKFEWCWLQCFHGASVSNQVPSAVETIKKIKINNNVQLLKSIYPLADIWEMCQPEYQGDFHLPIEETEYYFAFISYGQQMQVKGIAQEGFELLTKLQQSAVITPIENKQLDLIYFLQKHHLLEVMS